ncbi:hypothetical protein TGRUB_433960 [Toxoplasma gondii RUB]|uniref:Uncharacterized protein n=1 Tax=Toxoplasma gondii RUB TaxID=935652 RepID=A0A086LJ40_TOXGO|nr:hypothetical protein TGRUB_433960 [Toxoplasma gondii RUB]
MTCCRYPSESECPAWDAWANPVADASDPSSLVSEYAACGMWRPRMVLPFSRMSLVAYLRGWVRGCWLCVVVQSVCEIVGRILQAAEVREEKDARACSVSRGNCRTTWRRRLRAGGTTMAHTRHRCSPRSGITLARSVDVLGVAAPYRPAVVWYATRRVHARMGREYKGERCSLFYLWRRLRPRGETTTCTLSSMTCCRYPSESECPAWDAWVNPVADANDPSSLVSEYAACGMWRPRMVLLFSRLSLVAYLRGCVRGCWLCVVVQSDCEIVRRSVQPAEKTDEKDAGACGVSHGNCRTT